MATTNNKQNESRFSFDEISDLKVSKHTAEWIKVYKDIQDVWSRVYSLIEQEIGASQVDETFDKEFSPHLLKLLDATLDGFRDSVWYAFEESKEGYL